MNQLPHTRRYIVAGIDSDGDVQAFASDDRTAADEVREQMEDDLTDVQLIDTESNEAANDG
jgi:hypothetical protein